MIGDTPRRKFFVSLGPRIAVPVVLLVVTVAIAVDLGLVRQSRLSLLSSKELAADMVVKLTSVSMMPAVVFDDGDEIQRTVDNLARNPDVSDVEIWSSETPEGDAAKEPRAQFHRGGSRRLGRPSSPHSQRFRDADAIRAIEPIVNPQGKTVAALVVRFSTARESAALSRLSRQIAYVSLGTAFCLALAILIAIHRVVVRPIKELEDAASKLARGEQHTRKRPHARVEDEVVRLEVKFGEMADAVRDRELRLGVKNAELKLILDSVDQGFMTARVDGSLLPERSAILEQWTGALPADATVWSLASKVDADAATWIRTGWSQVVDGDLPLEVAIDQLPRRLRHDKREFSLAYHPVLVEDALERMVIVMTDVTVEVERQHALAEQQEFAALVEHLMRDRRAFRAFWTEASKLVSRILEPSEQGSDLLRRNVHTLKGNARFFGLNRISALCHEVESAMAERGTYTLTAAERESLRELWDTLRERIEPLMRGATVFLEVSRDEYEHLVEAVRQRKPAEEIERLLHDLSSEPVSSRFDRATAMLVEAAVALGKTPPHVEVRHDDLRVPPGPWGPFWNSLSHVLNNAVDHGIESDAERRSAGKSLPATVWLSARVAGDEVVIEVRDDGRGIAWGRVRELAAERGLPAQTQRDLEQALFADGFSLKHQVSEISGRGVGLGAVRNVVGAMGGKLEVESVEHTGTTWRFRFPVAVLGTSGADDGEGSAQLARPGAASGARKVLARAAV